MELTIRIDGVEKRFTVEKRGGQFVFAVDGNEYVVSAAPLSDGTISFLIGGRSYVAHFSKDRDGTRIALGGRTFRIESETDEGHVGGAGASMHGDGNVESPMPGNIVAVNVSQGDAVKAGQAVVVIESMKMQNEITSPVAGEVKKVNCNVGEQVNFGDVLVEIEPKK
jgi:biotin carboxyl carrier protein